MMNILIIEDNTDDRINLKQNLEIFLTKINIKFCIEFINSLDSNINFHKYDLIFLDVEVAGVNSIEFTIKEKLDKFRNKLIITSKYKKYLIDGYKIHAERFFLKPISQKYFETEMENVINNYFWNSVSIYVPELINRRIFIKEILYVEHLERDTIVNFINGESLKCKLPLKYWEQKLSEYGFTKPHRAFLVNLRSVSGFSKNEIILENDHKVPLSRNFKENFMNSYLITIQEVI